MKPGSVEFRKFLSKVFPQEGGEPKTHYLGRIARHFGISAPRMTILYYDSRKDNARFTPSEYQAFFGQNPLSDSQLKRLQENGDLREELAEIKALIRAEQAMRRERLKRLLEAFAG